MNTPTLCRSIALASLSLIGLLAAACGSSDGTASDALAAAGCAEQKPALASTYCQFGELLYTCESSMEGGGNCAPSVASPYSYCCQKTVCESDLELARSLGAAPDFSDPHSCTGADASLARCVLECDSSISIGGRQTAYQRCVQGCNIADE